MHNRRGALGALLLAALAASLLSPTSRVSAQATERSVYVSVLDEKGVPVPNLGAADFIVREDGQSREVLSVAPATDPMQIALLVDNSEAGEQYVRDYREAIPAFIKAMAADGVKHQFAVITIAERPTIVTDFTSDPAQALKGAQRIFSFSGSGTYLLDGIIETSQGLAKRRAERPVIIAITTEGPELSDRQYQAVLEPLKLSGAAFHAFTLGRPANNDHDRSVVLDKGSNSSGGRYETVLMGTALTNRLQQLATELRGQYKVRYARPARIIPPEQITVAAAKPDLKVRATPAVEPPAQDRP
jgi:VWFA-related protein